MGTPLLGAKVRRSSGYEDPEAMDQDWTKCMLLWAYPRPLERW
jgi:hypothetical protein